MISAYGGGTRPFGCYTEGELEGIRLRIEQLPKVRQEYERQRQLSEQFASREAAAPLHKLGVFRVEPFVFKTPPRTAFLKLSVQIRGKGTARIGGLRLTHSQLGLPVELANGGLESGMLGWSQDRENGSTVYLEKLASWQQGLQPSGVTPSGASLADDLQCICISNEEVKGLTILHYGETIPVYEGNHYSVQTALSLEALLGEGICIGVHFLNAAGQPLGTELLSPLFNRPTLTNWAYLLEATGADANMYMITGESEFAVRAKQKLQYMLADMRVGMDIFRRDGWHDDDTYGAVHIGRGLAAASVIYDQIVGSSVFLTGEETELLAHFRYIADMMMDTHYYRFDLETFPDEKGGKRSNWNADRATGLGVYALLFPNEKQSEAYLDHALSVINWQLAEVVDSDGAWPENIRYHGAVLHRYFLFFVLLKRLKGIDYFKHEKVKGMYRFLIGTVTVPDIIQGGSSGSPILLTPAVGDANVQEQWFRLLGYSAPFYMDEDPQLAGEMLWTWKHGGEPIEDSGAFPLPLVALLYPQPDLAEQRPALDSVHYPDIGYVIFRNGEQNLQHYAIYEASPLTYHAHHDEGHFSIWADGVPVTLDSGTGGYYNGDRHWYVSSAAHNVVQFTDSFGNFANGPLQSTCKEVRFSEELDHASSLIPDANARGYERNFLFIKAGFNVYLIWDRIEGASNSVWNLHTLSTDASIMEQSIDAACLNGKHLSAYIAEPELPVITMGEGAVAGNYPLAEQQHFRVYGGTSDYVILLHPRTEDAPSLQLEQLDYEEAVEGVRLYRISRTDGKWFIAAINGTKEERLVTVPGLGPLRLLGEPESTSGQPEPTQLRIEAGKIHIAMPR
ncbi:heparinase II/III family protein [Paenibacillus sp. FSL H7-0941]|uniref:heparinase II/III domain-containing protein n=1 Tax=Paenibacillus sp. FSL H7-0941 TaxID=2975351 RepID=UPI0030FD0CF6